MRPRSACAAHLLAEPTSTVSREDLSMPNKPLQTDDVRSSGEGARPGHARQLKHWVFEQVAKFLVVALYLWIVFGMLALHEAVVSAKYHINFHFYGFALVNSLILGKVMLVAEDLNFADRIKGKPLIYPILFKAIAFSILFLVFYVVEEVLVGLVRGKTIGASIPNIGGGTPSGVFFVALILAVVLIPFFAFREIGRVVGERELHALVFTEGAKAVA